MLNKNILRATLIIALLVGVVMIFGDQNMLIINIMRIVFGSVFILFLPGYFLTVNFFGNKEIDRLERVALSFALSIAVVPLLTFYSNLAGLKISQRSVYLIVCILIGLNIAYYYLPPRFKLGSKKVGNHE